MRIKKKIHKLFFNSCKRNGEEFPFLLHCYYYVDQIEFLNLLEILMTSVKFPILNQDSFKMPIEYIDIKCNNSVAILGVLFEIQQREKGKSSSLNKQQGAAC